MLDNIRVILINTYHPGNIGSAARAMKTMGLKNLWLVQPQTFPAPEATSMAAGATDLLEQAHIVETFDEAIADCSLVIGTSARDRRFPLPQLTARECAPKAIKEAASSQVALVFGRETMGLHNDELYKCNIHVSIPANPEYPVLNMAAAVQTLCYELYQSNLELQQEAYPAVQEEPYPHTEDMERFYQHLEKALYDIGFIVPQHPGVIMTRLRRFFNRSRPEQKEIRILRGILTSAQKAADKP
ncbi:tRNA (cytosine(32)/uridine(32)-2'-O)-methyltransferase TrmJ [Endozoicomonadaceae bacterium StTr2]